MEISEECAGNITFIAIKGRIDSSTANAFGVKLISLIKAGQTRLIVDLNRVTYITSAGWRELLLASHLAEQIDGALALCSLSEEVRHLYDFGGFADLFPIYETRDEGLTKLL